jgi:hypothetical protein
MNKKSRKKTAASNMYINIFLKVNSFISVRKTKDITKSIAHITNNGKKTT